MTLLYFDGFTDTATLPKPEWTTPFVSNQTGRDGSSNGGTGSGGAVTRVLALPTSAATCVVGLACQPLSLTTAVGPIVFGSDISTNQLAITVNSSGLIEARRGGVSGTLLGTSSGHTPIGAAEWHHFGLKSTLSTSSVSLTVYLDTVVVLSTSGVTSSVTGNVTHLRLQPNTGAGNSLWDDLYVCDGVDATATQGRPNNDFLGDLRVFTQYPNGAGDSTQWTPSTGSNYTTVDEFPPNTTDYVSDNVTGHRDLYAMTDYSGTVGNVYGVRTTLYTSKSDAGSALVKPAIKENSVVTTDTAQPTVFGTWTGIHGALRYVRPSDSAVWTATDINALQAGAEVG